MIDLYYDATPNGRKVVMALEELDLQYVLHWVRLDRGEQFNKAFRGLSPSAKIPALVHTQKDVRTSLFESGSILLYLAETFGALLPQTSDAKRLAINWLFWQTSTFGPTVGQATHFYSYAPAQGIEDNYSKKRFAALAAKLYGDLNDALVENCYVAGDFSIADIAIFPWVRVARGHGIHIDQYPNIKEWAHCVAQRPSANVKPIPPDRDTAFEAYHAGDGSVWSTLFTPDQN